MTQPAVELLTRAQYAAVVRPLLPAKAFSPSKRKLWQVGAHLAVMGLCMWGIARWDFWPVRLLLSGVIGHSLTCLVFLAHELTHGGMVRRASWRYPLEVFLWGLNLIPATMWRKLHNENHHVHANTPGDPDRYFRQSELAAPGGVWRRWYTRWFMPHRLTSRWNLGVGFHFVTYIVRHLATVFYPGDARPAIVTCKPAYRSRDRAKIIFEVACIAGFQYLIYLIVGRSVAAWLWAGPVALLFTSTYAMSYIWTNHYLHGMADFHDPVAGSTSIVVPRFFDLVHNYFSYHTEHHLFPGMNADYYPLVADVLREKFPERYHRITYRQAWQQLWLSEPYLVEADKLPDGVEAAHDHVDAPHGEFTGQTNPGLVTSDSREA